MSMLKYCHESGVPCATVYAFSIDNYKRSPEEVQSLMDLMLEKIEEVLKEDSIVSRYGIVFSGNLKLLSESVRLAADRARLATAKNSKAILSVCVAYTSTNEILHAVQESCEEKWDEITILNSSGAGYGLISLGGSEQDEMDPLIKLTDIEKHMYMAVAPDPDIIISTSGETRLEQFSFMAERKLLFILAFSTLAGDWFPSLPVGHIEFSENSFLLGQEKEAVIRSSQALMLIA
ncbi:hypothetical protein V6N13_020418 [Hibiscus sabdariffa]|uniref:Uncharacterized protein n=1 Tax=Hibiscus sabdariffa TaxID=183260 RepID=A0ABR2ETE1_9ROSI